MTKTQDLSVGPARTQDAANRGAIKTVQVKGPNSNWESMNNVWGASWEMTSVPQPPLDIRIQDDTGTEVHTLPCCMTPCHK